MNMRRLSSVRIGGPAPNSASVDLTMVSGKVDVPTDAAVVMKPPWWQEGERFYKRYRIFLGVTAGMHLLSGVSAAYIVSKKNWPMKLCASYSIIGTPLFPGFTCFKPVYNDTGTLSAYGNGTSVTNTCIRETAWRSVGELNPGAMVVAFFFLSAIFQFVCILPVKSAYVGYPAYKRWLEKGTQPLRFIEYSVSSSLMVMIISLLNGEQNIWLVLALAGCNWSTMIFGLFSEQVMALSHGRDVPWIIRWGAHLAGWLPFVVVWTVLFSQFQWSLDVASDVPDPVKAIPAVQLVLFAIFGINQMVGSLAVDNKWEHWVYLYNEIIYTVLSLAAKSILAWLLLGGTFALDTSKLVPKSLCG